MACSNYNYKNELNNVAKSWLYTLVPYLVGLSFWIFRILTYNVISKALIPFQKSALKLWQNINCNWYKSRLSRGDHSQISLDEYNDFIYTIVSLDVNTNRYHYWTIFCFKISPLADLLIAYDFRLDWRLLNFVTE